MKRAAFGAIPEVAPVAGGAERALGDPQLRCHQALLDQLTAAARRDDREEFDRLFERCFERVYAIAWRVTRTRERAQIITARILCEAVISTP